jgi:hypothetical protein
MIKTEQPHEQIARDIADILASCGPWYKLNQFRRHPDWTAAFHRVEHSHRNLFVKFDGRWMLPGENAKAFIEAVDQEFIDEIIRREADIKQRFG